MLGWNELIKKELGYCGQNVFIGYNTLFVNPKNIYIENNVRIDPFVFVSVGELHIGNNVQICSHAILGGGYNSIFLNDWTFIGYHSQLFTASEDYSGNFGPVNQFWNKTNSLSRGDIIFNRFSGIASNVTIMPGVELPEGTCIGTQSFVYSGHYYGWGKEKLPLQQYTIYAGNPLKYLKDRNKTELIKWKNIKVDSTQIRKH